MHVNDISADRKSNFIKRCWTGTARLWQAYWLVGVLGQFVVMLLWTAVTYPFWRGPQDNWWTYIVGAVLFLAYLIFASVSIWRCAPNASNPAWGALAKTVLVLSWVYGLFSVWRVLSQLI